MPNEDDGLYSLLLRNSTHGLSRLLAAALSRTELHPQSGDSIVKVQGAAASES
ncbi:hypothetical protein H6F76_23235 [Leptolyngbya sp. FACHB-321]|uniref:hypothetical protein n=1 Tax=Leptolyngbya sp. FACHB-321 TaxID=2692807 RepID=UPI0016860758|nr:hypothetical protein [Leptolyngbya sp. FACHB-321]MBD2037871.1 hypothetical protein [Leptolyngbya sp. FACHB-321]